MTQVLAIDAIRGARWVMLDSFQRARSGRYSWPQCSFCGRAQSHDCPVVTCPLCGTSQCHGSGSGNGCCAVCHHGWLPGWSRGWSLATQRVCNAYKGCEHEAVATARKRSVCLEHAQRIKVSKTETLAEYVARTVAERDGGKGWQRWRLVDARGQIVQAG